MAAKGEYDAKLSFVVWESQDWIARERIREARGLGYNREKSAARQRTISILGLYRDVANWNYVPLPTRAVMPSPRIREPSAAERRLAEQRARAYDVGLERAAPARLPSGFLATSSCTRIRSWRGRVSGVFSRAAPRKPTSLWPSARLSRSSLATGLPIDRQGDACCQLPRVEHEASTERRSLRSRTFASERPQRGYVRKIRHRLVRSQSSPTLGISPRAWRALECSVPTTFRSARASASRDPRGAV
ncbi:hypothetical protein ABMA10_05060 [Plantibacter sp. RU18]